MRVLVAGATGTLGGRRSYGLWHVGAVDTKCPDLRGSADKIRALGLSGVQAVQADALDGAALTKAVKRRRGRSGGQLIDGLTEGRAEEDRGYEGDKRVADAWHRQHDRGSTGRRNPAHDR